MTEQEVRALFTLASVKLFYVEETQNPYGTSGNGKPFWRCGTPIGTFLIGNYLMTKEIAIDWSEIEKTFPPPQASHSYSIMSNYGLALDKLKVVYASLADKKERLDKFTPINRNHLEEAYVYTIKKMISQLYNDKEIRDHLVNKFLDRQCIDASLDQITEIIQNEKTQSKKKTE